MRKGLSAGGGMLLGMIFGIAMGQMVIGMIIGLLVGGALAARRRSRAAESTDR